MASEPVVVYVCLLLETCFLGGLWETLHNLYKMSNWS